MFRCLDAQKVVAPISSNPPAFQTSKPPTFQNPNPLTLYFLLPLFVNGTPFSHIGHFDGS